MAEYLVKFKLQSEPLKVTSQYIRITDKQRNELLSGNHLTTDQDGNAEININGAAPEGTDVLIYTDSFNGSNLDSFVSVSDYATVERYSLYDYELDGTYYLVSDVQLEVGDVISFEATKNSLDSTSTLCVFEDMLNNNSEEITFAKYGKIYYSQELVMLEVNGAVVYSGNISNFVADDNSTNMITVTISKECTLTLIGVDSSETGSYWLGGFNNLKLNGQTMDVVRSDAVHFDESNKYNEWIMDTFAFSSSITGDISKRTSVYANTIVLDAHASNAKYAFDLKDTDNELKKSIAFTNVTITDLVSSDAYGAGVRTTDGVDVFLSNVIINPGWPEWVDYSNTNYDGLDGDGNAALYAEDLHVIDWNADGAIDFKGSRLELVRVKVSGKGNRALRIWKAPIVYIVDSIIENTLGSILWVSEYTTEDINLYVWNSTFNGSSTIRDEDIENFSPHNLNIIYLSVSPIGTGEMHEMFDANIVYGRG